MKHRRDKHVCRNCAKHRALFLRPNWGGVRADKDHELCYRCYRAAMNSLRTGHARVRAIGAAA